MASPNTKDIPYVMFALELQDGGEDPDYYTLVKGAWSENYPASMFVKLGGNATWDVVLITIKDLRPSGWTILQTADWLSQCDGFLAFEYSMLSTYALTSVAIQNRAFTYEDVWWFIANFEWWTEDEPDVWTKHVGKKDDYVATGGGTKLVRIAPMPIVLKAGN